MGTKSPRRTILKLLIGIIFLPIFLLCSILTVFAFMPPEVDDPIPLAEQGGGARQDDGAVTGLQAAWAVLPEVNAQTAELGRMLFYDPVLSVNDDVSCATCHHPDLGFADGRQFALGAHEQDLRRNAPSLWNVAFSESLFWDGRARSLEEQLLIPLANPEEMGADLDEMVAELQTIPDYVALFDASFDDGVTVDNIASAIASFQRTLISDNAPFDRFAAGDFNALTPQQRRGFDIFRSAETRCFECHTYPTFTANTFHVLGVPDSDLDNPDRGRLEIQNAPDAEFGFRTPGLRNVVLSAPYMHNGSLGTLEEVIQFYEDGGGLEAGGVDVQVDEKIRGFDLTDQETQDLIAFLYALTDEPAEIIAIPESVPSGLTVITHEVNPSRDLVEVSNAEPFNPEIRDAQTITVQAGETIQSAVDRALPGDTILVEAGLYQETVYVDMPNITIRGIVDGDERPWLDGMNEMSDGFNTTGDDFVLEGFGLRRYIGNAVLTTGAERIVYRDLIIEGTDAGDVDTIYGLYPVECTDVLIENTIVTGIADAAIYVGQSRGPIVVRNNEVYGNVTGIEIENSVDAEVYDNYVHNNTGGILVFLLPNNPSRVGHNTRVYNNRIIGNNHPNFAAEGATVGLVPSGTGVMIMTADNTEVFDNEIRDNQTVGVLLTSLYTVYGRDTVFDLGPIPENNWVHGNVLENNGYDPQGLVVEEGLPGADILWSGEGWNNAFDQPGASMFPPILPGRDWPTPARRALSRLYSTVVGLLLE
ncbi:MAG: parallel beta-helix domain-containing protein [Aggregatilineales bacterium]